MRKIDLFLAWIHDFFKHPLEDIRQASPIKPKRLYYAFGNIVKAVPYTRSERYEIALLPVTDKENPYSDPIRRKCLLCHFYKEGLPCPIYNTLPNGNPVCDHYKYTIIKKA